jgi:hypothetical protein
MTREEVIAALRLRTVLIATSDGKQVVGVPRTTLMHLGLLTLTQETATAAAAPAPTAELISEALRTAESVSESPQMDPEHEAWLQELL